WVGGGAGSCVERESSAGTNFRGGKRRCRSKAGPNRSRRRTIAYSNCRPTSGNALGRCRFWHVQLVPECSLADPEQLRRSGAIAVRGLERALNREALEVVEIEAFGCRWDRSARMSRRVRRRARRGGGHGARRDR